MFQQFSLEFTRDKVVLCAMVEPASRSYCESSGTPKPGLAEFYMQRIVQMFEIRGVLITRVEFLGICLDMRLT
jgi:hypothetical protein